MLELFARLLSSQQNISGNNLNNPHENSSENQNSYYQNSAFNNYPREAFIQNVNNSNLNQSQQPNNNPFGQNGLSALGNLLNNGDNNILPLLLSILGKGGGGGLGGIMEALTQKPIEKNEKPANDTAPSPFGDEIIL